MTSLLNDPDEFVAEACAGFARAYPQIHVNHDPLFLYRSASAQVREVALISGGGSGHEPMHSGCIGVGMLDAACPGRIFTSPTVDQIEAAVRRVATSKKAVLVVKNYTGDVLCFQAAAELLGIDDIETGIVLVHDDVATAEDEGQGRRGAGGTIIVERLLGGAADRGASITALTQLGEKVSARTRSMGIGLSSCRLPGRDEPLFELPHGQVEFGIGIHGERGRRRGAAQSAHDLMNYLVEQVIDDHDLAPAAGADLLVLVNGAGATSLAELYLCYGLVEQALLRRGFSVPRRLVGNYVTSLDLHGISLTITELDDELTSLWDTPVDTPALRSAGHHDR